MSLVCSREEVLAVADKLGVDAEAVSVLVSSEVDFQLRRVVQDACKFMRHSKRLKMTSRDVDSALRLRGLSTLHGYGSADPVKFTYHRQNQGQTLFFMKEREIDLAELAAKKDGLPPVPLKPTYAVHWLAVEGIQPAIRENPSSLVDQNETEDPAATVKDPAIVAGKRGLDGSTASGGAYVPQKRYKTVKHQLSKELQIYLQKVVTTVRESAVNPGAAENVYANLAVDPGLQPMLRYLTKFISDEVNRDLRNLGLLYAVMRLARCLLVNPNLNTELYLHQLMPPILTCLVSKRLCESPFDDHWSLRDLAASLVKLVCLQYSEQYSDLQPRITMTLCAALKEKKKPMTTQYGTIIGLCTLGPLTVHSYLLPRMEQLLRRFTKATTSSNVAKRQEAVKCLGALHRAFGGYLTSTNVDLIDQNKNTVQHVTETLGESVVYWMPDVVVTNTFL